MSEEVEKENFTVMRQGDVIEFSNPNGSGTVSFSAPFLRVYVIDGKSYTVRLEQRPKEFRGQKGIYSPGVRASKSSVDSKRFVVEESTINFDSKQDMLDFLDQGGDYFKWVSNNQGYALGFLRSQDRNQINVSLFRFYLQGKVIREIPQKFNGQLTTRNRLASE